MPPQMFEAERSKIAGLTPTHSATLPMFHEIPRTDPLVQGDQVREVDLDFRTRKIAFCAMIRAIKLTALFRKLGADGEEG